MITFAGREAESRVEYSERFRSEMVSKMLGPQAVSANALSKRVGVRQPTLSRWLREAKLSSVSKRSKVKESLRHRRVAGWTAEEKLRVVSAAAGLGENEVGELLRREGLHEAELGRFREEALTGLSPKPRANAVSPEKKRIAELERELRRKEKALAEAAALLVLRKKVDALWPAEGDDTDETSGR
jgi:transposase